MITVHGFAVSGNCLKVGQILRSTVHGFAWIEVHSNAGGTRTPEFLALNPNAKIPIVELDDGQVITESGAILGHFAEGTDWLPPAALDVMERCLATHKWLTDSSPTTADLALFAYTHVAEAGEFNLARWPGIQTWIARLAALPGIETIEGPSK
jgi:glutathione S-transferase